MRSFMLARICLALIVVLVVLTTTSNAKINLNLQVEYYDENGEMLDPYMAGIERWDATTGDKILRYDVIDRFGGTPESVVGIAMKGNRLYANLNNLGFMDIIRLNPNTGQTIVPPGYVCCGIGVPFANYFGGGEGITFDIHGDLFVTGSNAVLYESPGDRGAIFRFDGQTGALKGSVELAESQSASRVGVAPGGDFFYALQDNPSSPGDSEITKFSYSESSNFFTPVTEFPLAGHYGDLTVGPDGVLYLSNYTDSNVLKYDTDGNFLGEFMEVYAYDFEWIEGKLLALTFGGRVVEINPLDGSIVDTLIDASTYAGPGTFSFLGMAAFSVVPEPSAACLAIGLMLMANRRQLSRKRL